MGVISYHSILHEKFKQGLSRELGDAASIIASVFGFAMQFLHLNETDTDTPKEVFRSVLDMYSQDYRVYHDFRHIAFCLELLKKNFPKLSEQDYALLAFGVIFHDIIWLVGNNANEQSSAQFAKESLMKMGLSEDKAMIVHNIIMATWYTEGVPAETELQKIMVDLDYAGLGSSWETYLDQTKRVVKEIVGVEYEKMPEFAIKKRVDFVRFMLNKDRIYNTEVMHDKYEHHCRANLKKELGMLLKLGNLKESNVPFMKVGEHLEFYQVPNVLGPEGIVVTYQGRPVEGVVEYEFSCEGEQQKKVIKLSAHKAQPTVYNKVMANADMLRKEGLEVIVEEEGRLYG